MRLFEDCIVIFLVMPGKPSFRLLDPMFAFSIRRAVSERCRVDQQNRALEAATVTLSLHGPMFTNGKNARNIQSSFSRKTRILPGILHLNLVITRSAGARQRTVLVKRTVLKRTSQKLKPSRE